MQILYERLVSFLLSRGYRWVTYKAPRLNMEAKLNFRESFIWRPNSFGIGSATTKMSMIRLVMPEATHAVLCPSWLQVPTVLNLSQLYRTGEQNTKASTMTETRYIEVMAMNV